MTTYVVWKGQRGPQVAQEHGQSASGLEYASGSPRPTRQPGALGRLRSPEFPVVTVLSVPVPSHQGF